MAVKSPMPEKLSIISPNIAVRIGSNLPSSRKLTSKGGPINNAPRYLAPEDQSHEKSSKHSITEPESDEDDSEAERFAKLLKMFDSDPKWIPVTEGQDCFAEVSRFLKPYPTLCTRLDGSDENDYTLLDLLFITRRKKVKQFSDIPQFDRRRDFFKWVMNKKKDLYQRNDSGFTILGLAIHRAREGMNQLKAELREEAREFIEFFVDEYPSQTAVLLRTTDTHLLHELLYIVPKQYRRSLIGSLDKDTVMKQDADGNTVLHLASKYQFMCEHDELESPAQLQLVERITRLLEVCPDALTTLNKRNQSPYQYRVSTYYEHEKQLGRAVDRSQMPLPDDKIAQLFKERYIRLVSDERGMQLVGDGQETPQAGVRQFSRQEILKYLHGNFRG